MIITVNTIRYYELPHLPLKLTDAGGGLPSTNMVPILASAQVPSHSKKCRPASPVSILQVQARRFCPELRWRPLTLPCPVSGLAGRLQGPCLLTPPGFRRKTQRKDGGSCSLNSSRAARLRTRAALEGAGPGLPSASRQLGDPVALPPHTPVPPSLCS